MLYKMLSGTALFGLMLAPLPAHADRSLELKSVSINLPESDKSFPAGQGSEAINNNCLACHSVGMVLYQPPLSKVAWTAEVKKMIKVYKAPIAAEDIDPIVDYLTRFSAKK